MTILFGKTSSDEVKPVAIDADGKILVAPYPHSVLDISGLVQFGYRQTANNNTITLYTVPANRVAYITSIVLYISNQTAGPNTVFCEVWTSVPALSFDWLMGALAGGIDYVGIPLTPPFKLAAGWSMRVRSPAVNLFGALTITGYEIAA